MATVSTPKTHVPNDRVVLYNVSWETYATLRRNLDRENSHVRLTYDGSNLEIMSPSRWHELSSRVFALMLSHLTFELEIPIAFGGATTFQRADLERGLEPDECFWIAHEAVIRAKREIDLSIDPPPDLAIEIDISPSRLDRPGIYAVLGVPEIWRFDGEDLHVEKLQSDGTYRPSESSQVFPFLPVGELPRFIGLTEQVGQTRAMRMFVDWIREQNFPTHPEHHDV